MTARLMYGDGRRPDEQPSDEVKRYVESLEAWDSGRIPDPLRRFLKEQTVKTREKQIARGERGWN